MLAPEMRPFSFWGPGVQRNVSCLKTTSSRGHTVVDVGHDRLSALQTRAGSATKKTSGMTTCGFVVPHSPRVAKDKAL